MMHMVLSTGSVSLLPSLNIPELQLSRLWTVKLGKGDNKGTGSVRVIQGQIQVRFVSPEL